MLLQKVQVEHLIGSRQSHSPSDCKKTYTSNAAAIQYFYFIVNKTKDVSLRCDNILDIGVKHVRE